jgi:DNA polymerase I-like protein with 3'-5' exonuclease and polymerase domains
MSLALSAFKQLAEKSDILSFDIETTGLHRFNDSVIGFGISNGINSAYIAHLAFEDGQLVELATKQECIKALNLLKGKKLVTWNGAFDLPRTLNYFGVDLLPDLWSDAMLAKHTIDEDPPFGLKEVAAKIFGQDSKAEQLELKEELKARGFDTKSLYKADYRTIAKYCMQDCVLTFQLNDIFVAEIEQQGLTKFFFEDEVMPLYREVTIPMESRGVPLDLDLMRATLNEISTRIAELDSSIKHKLKDKLVNFNEILIKDLYAVESRPFAQALVAYMKVDLPKTETGQFSLEKKKLQKLPNGHIVKEFLLNKKQLPEHLITAVRRKMHEGKESFNLMSKDDLRTLFFTVLKERPNSFTAKGAEQVNEEFLLSVKDKYDWVPLLIEFNSLNKIKSTYIERFLEQEHNGIFYPSFMQHRTTSGRYGGDLQQLPKMLSEEDEPNEIIRYFTNKIRNFFIAGDGYKFVDADYASLEVVVFADDAGDKSLIDMIKNDYDFYSTVAIDVHNLADQYSADKRAPNFLKKHQPKLRQDAKVYGLGIRYGMKDFKLSKTLNIEIEQAGEIIKKYFETYPSLKTKMDYYLQSVKTTGMVKSKAGRIRHIPFARECFLNHGDDILDMSLLRNKYQYKDKAKFDELCEARKRYNNALNNALNFPIQSLAASIVNQASIRLARKIRELGLDAYICMNVHDEICVRIKAEQAQALVPVMKQIMENTITLSAPLTADPQIGDRYGEVK